MPIFKVDKDNFQSEVLKCEKPVLVDFWRERCGHCDIIAPVIEELAVEFGGKVKFAKMNVIQNPELAAQFGVWGTPTLAIFKRGELVDISAGVKPKSDIFNWILNALRL
ncbi:thioredoxin family protein [Rhizobium leguminosarum]|uniref:thioredoxin family protein n=1 Tax=Rhizobium leguminosarum TaxID=384 RepID=UPI001C8FB6ED|nr:thioredoxin domain-containing protein [Rhizobium leguminosarum]MBY2926969.1 thioredoxin fold domain-containing protein [Rhizobium leguminosarum]MBY2938030.1 thioredoxin fold domain-containing protein [Rhizobium leguminosarum]